MALLPNPIIAFTAQDLLDLMERLLPSGYLEPLKAGSGYEVLQAYAQVLARVSQAAERLGQDAQVSTAGDGSLAVGAVELYRTTLPTSGEQIPGQVGVAASIVLGAGAGQMRVSGLTNMSAASVGHHLVLANTYSLENASGFLIAAYVSATSVDVVNAAAVVPDLNNGAISWLEEVRAVVVKAGTIVTTSSGGRDFATTVDVAFAPTALGPFSATIQALGKDYAWNVPGTITAADGELLPGDIDTIKTLVEDPPMLDLGIQVRQPAATTGGAAGTLTPLGIDRGVPRYTGEALDQYRARVRTLPDTISPSAFVRSLNDLLRPWKGEYAFIETWQIEYTTCWDAPGEVIPGSPFDPNGLAYDDPRVDVFHGRWLDTSDMRGGVIAVIAGLQPLASYAMVWDDTAISNADLSSSITGGSRAVAAWDLPSDYALAIQGAWDGDDYRLRSLYLAISDTMQAIKAGGVATAVELLGE
jgi:hypothetical protein